MPYGDYFDSLGAVLRDRRTLRGVGLREAAAAARCAPAEWAALEAGTSDWEVYGRLLAACAVALRVPTRMLVSPAGERGAQGAHADDAPTGQLVRRARAWRGLTLAEAADAAELDAETLNRIEGGEWREFERASKALLRFAEAVDARLYDLLYPGHRLPPTTLDELAAKRRERAALDEELKPFVEQGLAPPFGFGEQFSQAVAEAKAKADGIRQQADTDPDPDSDNNNNNNNNNNNDQKQQESNKNKVEANQRDDENRVNCDEASKKIDPDADNDDKIEN